MEKSIIGIVAMTEDRVIGNNGDLPWDLPKDLQFFKKTTLNSPIVMGRKTYESIGRPLPKRRNIVLTRDPNWKKDGVEVINRVEDLDQIPDLNGKIFIIGGAEIYNIFLPLMDELIITNVIGKYEGDTYFPEYKDQFRKSMQVLKEDDFFVVKYF